MKKNELDKTFWTSERLTKAKELDGKYLKEMTPEEIDICGGEPRDLLLGNENSNIYEIIGFNFMPVYHSLPPWWEISWDDLDEK